MKILSIIKGIISYILALVLALIFALFVNANVGWFMLIALILAFILSVFFAWITCKSVTVYCEDILKEADISERMLSKGEWYDMAITVKNRSIFPTTPIELTVLNGDGVKSADKNIIISVMPMSVKTFTIRYNAHICGVSEIGVGQVKITDYLGILSLTAKKLNYKLLRTKLAVIPEMAEVSPKDDRILKVMQASLHADDSEDTVEATINTFGGFPGYDNREYVPGDPLKRINWKQSAKRDKILVRLDDEVASQSVNIVLDSVYKKWLINPGAMHILSQYEYCQEEDIIPKIAEDAVENTLGIAKVLVQSNYTVNLYVYRNGSFERYQLEDEKDIEDIRIGMSDYGFSSDINVSRFPANAEFKDNGVCIFTTPNSYNDAYGVIESYGDITNTSVFSVVTDAKENNTDGISMYFGKKQDDNRAKKGIGNKIKEHIVPLIVPVFLATILSITVFSAFKVSMISIWTILSILVCALVFLVCNIVKKHKLVGTLCLVIMIVMLLNIFTDMAFLGGNGTEYMQWFMSGGDVVETTTQYLTTLLLVFPVFFSLVIYYYTQIYYRTSALLLISLIPCVVYAKIIREIDIKYVMLTIILNVSLFLINSRKNKDKNKRIIGYKTGLVSLGLYGILFVLIAFAVPKSEETKYYYHFEEAFLGGNTSTILPIQFTGDSRYSGNADNFNKLNNRKLYTVTGALLDNPLYLKRQVFDYYDYDKDRWYGDKEYSAYSCDFDDLDRKEYLNVGLLAKAVYMTEELSPGFVEKYNLDSIINDEIIERVRYIKIESHNYSNFSYIAPSRNVGISSENYEYITGTPHGVWKDEYGNLDKNAVYEVRFYDEFSTREKWIDMGGADYSTEEVIEFLEEMKGLLESKDGIEYEECQKAVDAYLEEARMALEYREACEDNTKEIPKSVRNLAIEITKDCEYDWEKAEALQAYFNESDFVYDLSYEAPDDSVEYFLFEGKTGTCSDFASAYVLMARAAGLTVRYVEGFVPEVEADEGFQVEYIVRTRTAHAYPEVYIQNFGFVVYEPTVAAIASENDGVEGGVAGFALTLGYRILIIFAMVSLVIIVALIITKILVPIINEKSFMHRVNKATPKDAVAMLYLRIVEKYAAKRIENGVSYTPKEYADKFKAIYGSEIMVLADMIEKSAYKSEQLNKKEKKQAVDIYINVKQAVKEHKKN